MPCPVKIRNFARSFHTRGSRARVSFGLAVLAAGVTLAAGGRRACGDGYTVSPGDSEFSLRIRGAIDGSDRLKLTAKGAVWTHLHWGWPGQIMLGGLAWDVNADNWAVRNRGGTAFMPADIDFRGATLTMVRGLGGNRDMNRDTVAIEQINDGIMVCFADTPFGAAPYDFTITFPRRASEAQLQPVHTGTVYLRVHAAIDGSDELHITQGAASWQHHHFGGPQRVSLNDISWDPGKTSTLQNANGTQFLDQPVDFSTARVVRRSGRDTLALTASRDGLTVFFADNPNGGDDYDAVIALDTIGDPAGSVPGTKPGVLTR